VWKIRVTPEKTGLICELFVRHGKKPAYLVEYLRIYWTDLFTIFSPYHSTLGADNRPVPRFPVYQGTLPLQSIDFGKMSWTLTVTTCVLCTIARKGVAILLSMCALTLMLQLGGILPPRRTFYPFAWKPLWIVTNAFMTFPEYMWAKKCWKNFSDISTSISNMAARKCTSN